MDYCNYEITTSTVPPLAVIVTRYVLSNTSSDEGSVLPSASTWMATRVTSALPPTASAVPKSLVPEGVVVREGGGGGEAGEREGRERCT